MVWRYCLTFTSWGWWWFFIPWFYAWFYISVSVVIARFRSELSTVCGQSNLCRWAFEKQTGHSFYINERFASTSVLPLFDTNTNTWKMDAEAPGRQHVVFCLVWNCSISRESGTWPLSVPTWYPRPGRGWVFQYHLFRALLSDVFKEGTWSSQNHPDFRFQFWV